jgi:hypothetical protein
VLPIKSRLAGPNIGIVLIREPRTAAREITSETVAAERLLHRQTAPAVGVRDPARSSIASETCLPVEIHRLDKPPRWLRISRLSV